MHWNRPHVTAYRKTPGYCKPKSEQPDTHPPRDLWSVWGGVRFIGLHPQLLHSSKEAEGDQINEWLVLIRTPSLLVRCLKLFGVLEVWVGGSHQVVGNVEGELVFSLFFEPQVICEVGGGCVDEARFFDIVTLVHEVDQVSHPL